MKKALILGGGGSVGIAWEQGLVNGLKRGGVDLGDADIIIGTSAGSIVGSQLAAGTLQEQAETTAAEVTEQLDTLLAKIDLQSTANIFELWSNALQTPDLAARVGELAASARCCSEQEYIALNTAIHQLQQWPNADLRVTALQVDSGELHILTAANAPFNRAITASCAVPGMFPPITINGKRYMDGGVVSCTHADQVLAEGVDVAIIIAPLTMTTATFAAGLEHSLTMETRLLENAGIKVLAITPDEADARVFGPNMMDSQRAGAVWQAGFNKGLLLAGQRALIWNQAGA